MAIADAHGLPIAGIVGSASPHEVTYVKETIHNCFIEQKPYFIIGDKEIVTIEITFSVIHLPEEIHRLCF
jgi:hypothetical protein